MPTSYTSLLGLALPVTGELSGTWGDTVNDYISKYVDAAVAGTQVISGSQTAVTLSPTNGSTLSQVGSGSTGSSQYQVINCTGNPGSTLTITVSYSSLTNAQFSKTYAVINATSTSQSVVVRATTSSGTSTGVTVASGERCLISWNGSDFTKIATSAVDGVSTFSAGTTGFTPSTATSGAVTLAGTLATTNGGTGLSSFTANRVFYSSSTSAIGSSANLTFDGTTLTAANFADSSLTAGRVTYAGASGNLTDSANMTFNGTTLTVNDIIDSSLTASKPVFTDGNKNLVSTGTVPVDQGGTGLTSGTSGGVLAFTASGTIASSGALAANSIVIGGGAGVAPSTTTTGTGVLTAVGNAVNTTGGLVTQSGTLASNNVLLGGGSGTAISSSNLLAVAAAVTTGNYIRAIGYADTVTALGNTGTAINLDVTSGGVFTATLTGNATITLRYPVATGSSSFTLILTNDGTAGRTVAWAGGAFRFPGGAASLSRTTTANAVDIWVFFTPDGGTTWYGNIAMKNMTA